MTQEEIQREILEIEKIHSSFDQRLALLKKEQNNLVNDFLKKLENRKIEEVRASLVQQQ